MTRIFVVAPTLAERTGLRALLEGNEGTIVVAEMPQLSDVEQLPPNIDILLLSSVEITRSDLTRILNSIDPSPGVLLLTDEQELVRLLADVCIGSWGVLNADCTEEELIITIEGMYRGLVVAEPQFVKSISAPYFSSTLSNEEMTEALTDREHDVLQLLAHGLSNKQIAVELDISEHTVKFHLSSIYAKLNAVNRAEAVSLGVRYGLITL